MMYCPECRAEYREGFTKCADCGVRLVDEPSSVPPSELEFVDLEEVLTTIDYGQIALAKSILDAEAIHYVAHGEHSHSLQSSIPVRFLVAKEDVARAREVLDHLL
jgi:hypothetical protein